MKSEDYRVPVPDDVTRIMRDLGRLLAKQMPPGWGFGLLMFTLGEGGTMTWISNANREDMLKAMQEFLKAQGS